MSDKIMELIKRYPIKNLNWTGPHYNSWYCIYRSLYPQNIQSSMFLWTDPWERVFPNIDRVYVEYKTDKNSKVVALLFWDFTTTVEGTEIMCRIINDLEKPTSYAR